MNLIHDKFSNDENIEKQWKSIYTLGGIVTIIALTGILIDVIIGNVTGGNLSALPQTSIDRFYHDVTTSRRLLGLSHLDNFIVTRKSCPLTGPDRYREPSGQFYYDMTT